ncbi:MAG: TonB-dependent receptor domain-containing protein [Phenylobacterium sp.]
MAVGACAAGLPLMATAAAAAEAPGSVAEIVVTGTRLPKADLVADSPIRTVSNEQVASSGALTLESVLNRLPQVTPSYSSAANNPSKNGVAYVDLRGLGPSRNLVLLDGRRVVGADASNSVDLNTVPLALIERIEVVTGGASAVYGADAVAGVVNVILKHRFDGLQLDSRALVSQRGDGEEFSATLTGGRSFERASLMGSFGWSERNAIGKGARPFSRFGDTSSSAIPTGGYIVSRADAPGQAAINAIFGRYGVAPGAVSPVGGVAGFSFNPDGSLFATGVRGDPRFEVQNFRGASPDYVPSLFPGVYAYNFQPFNKLILPLRRWSGALFGEAEPADGVKLYAQAMATRYSASTALAPTPALQGANPLYPGKNVNGFTIPVTNPFIPPDLAQLLASRQGDTPALAGAGPGEEFLYRFRAVTLGPRQSTNLTATENFLAGAKIDLPSEWSADVYASLGRYTRREIQDGLLSVRRVEQLLDSASGGKDICPGGFNPFGGILSEACKSFVRVRAGFSTTIQQTNAVAVASGPVIRLPAGPVRAAVGLEYRAERYDFRVPAGLDSSEVAGFNPLDPLSGSVLFRDAFGELSIPLIADAPFAERVELTLGYRRSDERQSGGVDAYKAEVGWTAVPAVRFRASFQRAVRAPDIFERFTPSGNGPQTAIDPCALEAHPAGPILGLCLKQALAIGFTAQDLAEFSQDDPSVGGRPHGNPAVKPERATTLTAGVVFRPDWASRWGNGATATLDGYAIKIDGAIGFADPQLVLNACYNIGGATNPTYDPQNPNCLRFSRSAINFAVFDLDEPETNQSRVETAGVDAALAFRTDLAGLGSRAWLGRLDTRLSVSWLAYTRRQVSAAAPTYDFAGTIGGSGLSYSSNPRWRAEGATTWTSGPVEIGLAGRYVAAMSNAELKIDPLEPGVSGVGAAWYWDLSGRWSVTRWAELRAGVLNLFDRAPELYFPAVDASTDPSTYDVIGRRFWLGLTLRY